MTMICTATTGTTRRSNKNVKFPSLCQVIMSDTSNHNNSGIECSSHSSQPALKSGRRGDPRMHKAVSARLANHTLPLLDALREGGFDFPADAGTDTSIVDADGVTLAQRKNQLSRRVRMAKQQYHQPTNPSSKLQTTRVQTSITTSGTKRVAPSLRPEDDVDMSDDMANLARMAKYHPQYQPVRNYKTGRVISVVTSFG